MLFRLYRFSQDILGKYKNFQAMKNDRRDFLKLTGMAGLGLAGTSMFKGCTSENETSQNPGLDQISKEMEKSHVQHFNMSGFIAPVLDIVRVGIIGLGNRGPAHVNNFSRIVGVEIKALCDLLPEKTDNAKRMLEGSGHNPTLYSGSDDEWKKMCERDDIDLVIIATPLYMHADMAIYAMEHGKHAASEVPLAASLEECWKVVQTAERTRKHCMITANSAYNRFPLIALNMARQGFFGKIVHGEGGYIANKLKNNFSKNMYWDMWWLKQYGNRKGNIYPIHGFENICQIMDINRGDKMDFLVSVESEDFQMGEIAKKLAAEDDFFEPFADLDYRGNINTSVIKTSKGRILIARHDATTSRPETYGQHIFGTERSAMGYPRPPRISVLGGGSWVSSEEYTQLEKKYTPNILKKMDELAKNGSYNVNNALIMSWRMIDCIRNGFPLDIDVYDGLAWSSIMPLSEWSVKNGSQPIDVPDFTAGAWKTNKRNMDIDLEMSGNTELNLK